MQNSKHPNAKKNPKRIIVLYRDLCSTWSFLWCFIEGLGDRFPAFYTWWCITNSQKSLVKNIFYWVVLYTTQFYAFSHIFRLCKSLSWAADLFEFSHLNSQTFLSIYSSSTVKPIFQRNSFIFYAVLLSLHSKDITFPKDAINCTIGIEVECH